MTLLSNRTTYFPPTTSVGHKLTTTLTKDRESTVHEPTLGPTSCTSCRRLTILVMEKMIVQLTFRTCKIFVSYISFIFGFRITKEGCGVTQGPYGSRAYFRH